MVSSFQKVEFVPLQELLHFLLLEVANVAELQSMLLLLAEHSLLYGEFLLNDLSSLVLFQQFLQGFEVEMFGDGKNAKEEVVVQENNSFVVLLNRR